MPRRPPPRRRPRERPPSLSAALGFALAGAAAVVGAAALAGAFRPAPSASPRIEQGQPTYETFTNTNLNQYANLVSDRVGAVEDVRLATEAATHGYLDSLAAVVKDPIVKAAPVGSANWTALRQLVALDPARAAARPLAESLEEEPADAEQHFTSAVKGALDKLKATS